VTASPPTEYHDFIESKGEKAMSSYFNSDTLLDLGKARMREFHQEREKVRLARQARSYQPGRIQIALNRVVSPFKRLALTLEQRVRLGRALRDKAIAGSDEILVR
jgi:hypothetical protein